LTSIEAENAFAKSVIQAGEIVPEYVAKEKSATIKKSGVLEIVEKLVNFDDVGGMSVLKEWVGKRKRAFTRKRKPMVCQRRRHPAVWSSRRRKDPTHTKAIAKFLELPFVKLDAGRLFGSLVGPV